ncbi:unnamed protein product [Parajaminaea phylloscopi]
MTDVVDSVQPEEQMHPAAQSQSSPNMADGEAPNKDFSSPTNNADPASSTHITNDILDKVRSRLEATIRRARKERLDPDLDAQRPLLSYGDGDHAEEDTDGLSEEDWQTLWRPQEDLHMPLYLDWPASEEQADPHEGSIPSPSLSSVSNEGRRGSRSGEAPIGMFVKDGVTRALGNGIWGTATPDMIWRPTSSVEVESTTQPGRPWDMDTFGA